MNRFFTAGACLLMTTTMATAGGIDRSGQGIGALFEDGDYVELSYGSVSPNVSGVFSLSGASSGNITQTYSQLGMALKMQMSEQFSLALIYDQPFGADVDYEEIAYPIAGAYATVESNGVTALARYEFTPNLSVHGGVRYVEASGVYNAPVGGGAFYNSVYSEDGGTGFVLGGAYERDDIAMRVALTYSSEIDLELDGSVGDLSTTLPESINLDFQTGIAADTLLFGSVRYVAWDGFSLDDTAIAAAGDPANPTGSILSYDDDVYTLNIGVGRRFTDAFSASFSVGYEASTGDPTGQLGPTDGYISYQIGGAYTLDNGVELSGGIRYIDIGDVNTNVIAFGTGGTFNDNDAVAVGMKIAYNF